MPEDVGSNKLWPYLWAITRHANAEDWFVCYDVKIITGKNSPCELPCLKLIQNKRRTGNRLRNVLRGFLFPMESTENVEESKEERKSRCLDVLLGSDNIGPLETPNHGHVWCDENFTDVYLQHVGWIWDVWKRHTWYISQVNMETDHGQPWGVCNNKIRDV